MFFFNSFPGEWLPSWQCWRELYGKVDNGWKTWTNLKKCNQGGWIISCFIVDSVCCSFSFYIWTPRPLSLSRHFHIFISFCSIDVHSEHNFSEEKASTDPTVAQNEKVAKDEQDHPSRLTKINEEKTTMDPLVGQNEKVTKDEEDRPPRLAESLLRESQILSIGFPVVYKLSAELKLRREKGKIIKKSIGSPNELESRRTEKVLMVVAQREQERQRLSTAWSTTYWA